MGKKYKYLNIVVVCCLSCLLLVNQVSAQDTGKPVVRSVAYYTVGGGALGAGIGIAIWLLDPLAPSADLRNSVMQGYGVGVFFGLIFGIMQLNKQAVLPYMDDSPPPSEFEGNTQIFPSEGNSYQYADGHRKPPNQQIPLLSFQYRF